MIKVTNDEKLHYHLQREANSHKNPCHHIKLTHSNTYFESNPDFYSLMKTLAIFRPRVMLYACAGDGHSGCDSGQWRGRYCIAARCCSVYRYCLGPGYTTGHTILSHNCPGLVLANNWPRNTS